MTRPNKSFTSFLLSFLLGTVLILSCRLFGCHAFHTNQATVLRPIVIPSTVFLPSTKLIPSSPWSLLARSTPPPLDKGGRGRSASSWEGDDIRWVTRWKRRLRQNFFPLSHLGRRQPARTTILLLSWFMFLCQTITTILSIRQKHPTYWPSKATTIVWDVLWGTSISGPMILDGAHFPHLSPLQPHRYWTNGWLHANWMHWILLLDAWQRLPSWLETGLGTPLYLTTILIAQFTGNLAYTAWSLEPSSGPCFGWSAGICGLYSLWYVCQRRMKSPLSTWPILRRMIWMAVYGCVVAPGFSNAAHVGGLLGGLISAILFGPRFTTNYRMRRKWSTAVNPPDTPQDYQRAMGYDVKPIPSLVPLSLFWSAVAVLAIVRPKYRSIPILVWDMLWKPGSVYGLVVRP